MARQKKGQNATTSSRAEDHDCGGAYINAGGDHDLRAEPDRQLVERTEQRTPRSVELEEAENRKKPKADE